VRRAIAIAVACLLILPGVATSAARYAAPGGGPVLGCEKATPCSLSYAITAAAANDEVIVAPGTYPVGATIVASVPLTIRGETLPVSPLGEDRRPRIIGGPGVNPLKSFDRQVVADLTIESSGSLSGTVFMVGDGSVFERLELIATGPGALALRPGNNFTLSNSLLRASGESAGALFLQGTETGTAVLRNDTMIASGPESTGLGMFVTKASATVTIRATNTIVDAATDVSAGATPGGTGAIVLDHSNFDTAVGPVAGSDNQTTPPLFLNAGAGDFHQAPTSPTIDAGITDPANGPTDLDGNVRAYGGSGGGFIACGGAAAGPPRTDIGAYEQIYAIAVPAIGCVRPRPPGTRITAAKIRKQAGRARFRFRAIGAASGFQCRLLRPRRKTAKPRRRQRPFRACSSPKTYRNLKPGRHRFAVRAVSGAGPDPTPARKRFRIPLGASAR